MSNINNCTICDGNKSFYFEKKFDDYNLDAKYYICNRCGFVTSNTHLELSQKDWEFINHKYHSYHGKNKSPDDMNWFERIKCQSDLIYLLHKYNIIKNGNWVDFGCGDGKLSNLLKDKYNLKLSKYDIDFKESDYINSQELYSNKFDLLTLTSVLEHIRFYKEIDDILSLISDNGCFAVHTFINNVVPKDPNWFYLLPVHCSFHTNNSMQILFERYNFKYCLYNYDARMWLMFKHLSKEEIKILESKKDIIIKDSFVDFWK